MMTYAVRAETAWTTDYSCITYIYWKAWDNHLKRWFPVSLRLQILLVIYLTRIGWQTESYSVYFKRIPGIKGIKPGYQIHTREQCIHTTSSRKQVSYIQIQFQGRSRISHQLTRQDNIKSLESSKGRHQPHPDNLQDTRTKRIHVEIISMSLCAHPDAV